MHWLSFTCHLPSSSKSASKLFASSWICAHKTHLNAYTFLTVTASTHFDRAVAIMSRYTTLCVTLKKKRALSASLISSALSESEQQWHLLTSMRHCPAMAAAAQNLWDEQPVILSAFIICWRKLTLACKHLSQACVFWWHACECAVRGRWITCRKGDTIWVGFFSLCFISHILSVRHLLSQGASSWLLLLLIYPRSPCPTQSFICPVKQYSSVIG